MATEFIHNYTKFRPHFNSKALLDADTSMAYTTTGNKYRVDVDDFVGAGAALYKVVAEGAGSADVTTAGGVKLDIVPTEAFIVAVTEDDVALTAATDARTFYMPFAMTLTAIRATLVTAQTSGSIVTVDVNEGGTTILSTKLTIDNGETSSATAATAAVISDSALADGARITIDVDQIGDGTAEGLQIAFIGTRA